MQRFDAELKQNLSPSRLERLLLREYESVHTPGEFTHVVQLLIENCASALTSLPA